MLDWDVSNEAGYAEQWREVVREDKVRIQGGQKALDYSFRIGGARQFLKDGELFDCVIGNPPYFNIKPLVQSLK